MLCRVSTFGHLRLYAYLQLPAAFRSLSRPSSAPDAKAFSMCSYSLDLVTTRLFAHLLPQISPFRRLLLFPKNIVIDSIFREPYSLPIRIYEFSAFGVSLLNDHSFSLAILNYVSKLFSVICFIPVTLICISLYIRAFFLKKPDFFLLFSLFNSQTSVVTNVTMNTPWCSGGGKEIRTPDPLLARQVLSQLSYTPIFNSHKINDY